MSSRLFQVKLNDRDMKVFRTPSAQPFINPVNCGAVTAQLLGLVTPETANQMTRDVEGAVADEWVLFLSRVLQTNIVAEEYNRDEFEAFFDHALFPGFATVVLLLPNDKDGHYVVVGKSQAGVLVILDPQSRIGYFNVDDVYSFTTFVVFNRDFPRTSYQHETDYIDFLAEIFSKCKLNGGKRRRKTKRRLIAKRTLRGMNRRRRLL